jgi:hypothetical protein
MKGKKEEDGFDKLMKLTKLMKQENVKVAPKGASKGANKWRSQDPKFAEKKEKSADSVEAGGMQVDPSLKDEYENWRKDKIEEQNFRRMAAERKAKAEEAARKAAEESAPPDPA